MRRPKSIKQLLNQGKRMQRLYPNGWPGNMRAVLYLNAKKALESIAEVIASLLFNGIDQYFTHTAWQPSGVNFDLGLTYTPAAGDIGTEKTLIAGLLTKNASNQLVVTYTDINSLAKTLTLTAVTLAADTEYNIAIISDGNGIELSAGGQSVSDTDVIDIDSLSVDTWLSSDSKIDGGEFLLTDGVTIRGDVPSITISGPFKLRACLIVSRDDFIFSGDSNNSWLAILSDGRISFRVNGVITVVNVPPTNLNEGEEVILDIVRDASNSTQFLVNESLVSTRIVAGNLIINKLITTATNSQVYADLVGQLLFEDDSNGNTYEYLTANSVIDNGNGTATAENTGNTGAAFNATIQNFLPSDLVTINTRCNGVASDLSLTDGTRLQGGDFLLGNGTDIEVDIPALTLSGDFDIEFEIMFSVPPPSNKAIWGGSHTIDYYVNISNGTTITFWSSGSFDAFSLEFKQNIPVKVKFEMRGTNLTLRADGKFIQTRGANPYRSAFASKLFRSISVGAYFPGYLIFKLTKLDTGETYEYLTRGTVSDNGDGTATAENTGNTGSAFDATVQNFAPSDLVDLPWKSHAWPFTQAQAIQDDTVGTNNGTIVNYDGSMVQ